MAFIITCWPEIVDSANQATGGKVEIHDFDFRLSNLTANVYGLVIHGTEPNPDTPLLSIDHAYLDLKLVSLIHRKVDLNQIVVTRPVVHFFSDKNGRSNLPQPKTPKTKTANPSMSLTSAFTTFFLPMERFTPTRK